MDLLVDEIGMVNDTHVGLAPPDSGDDYRLTVYLYRVTESAHLRNVDRSLVEGADDRGTPLVVDLNYLVTAHPWQGRNNGGSRTTTQHELLGRVMQVLGDNAVLRGPVLTEDLRAGPDLRVTVDAESMDTVVNMWGTFDDEPFRPSVSYLVTPVVIDPGAEADAPHVIETTTESYTHGGEDDG